jgi:16S rRNA (cytosine1402-N4)-methyltransferase
MIGRRLSEKGRLLCLDRDPDAVRLTAERLTFLGGRARVVRGSYADLEKTLAELGIGEINGLLLDLGMSSFQLDHSRRGFTFQRDEPLDMRMDPDEPFSASDLVNTLSQNDLERLLRKYGEENRAGRIAKAIVRSRGRRPILTTLQLANLVDSITRRTHGPGIKHPATLTFQALRIAVNKELDHLDALLKRVPLLVAKGGRFVVLSYHSLEDRRVKQAMALWAKGCTCPPDFPRCVCGKRPQFRSLLRRGQRPSEREIETNPRARSAILRASERI